MSVLTAVMPSCPGCVAVFRGFLLPEPRCLTIHIRGRLFKTGIANAGGHIRFDKFSAANCVATEGRATHSLRQTQRTRNGSAVGGSSPLRRLSRNGASASVILSENELCPLILIRVVSTPSDV